MTQKDNSTFAQKRALRLWALDALEQQGVPQPIVCETHGGNGALWAACYPHLGQGVVFEKDAQKAGRLARQRPTWAVYEADCVVGLQGGVGGHLAFDLLDVDPYGDPWPVLDAFFSSERPYTDVMAVAVNDGLRQGVAIQAWRIESLRPMVEKYGNDLHGDYLAICREMMDRTVAKAGYSVQHFAGYYTGVNQNMTHYLAILGRV